jgi:hypothetical protein
LRSGSRSHAMHDSFAMIAWTLLVSALSPVALSGRRTMPPHRRKEEVAARITNCPTSSA